MPSAHVDPEVKRLAAEDLKSRRGFVQFVMNMQIPLSLEKRQMILIKSAIRRAERKINGKPYEVHPRFEANEREMLKRAIEPKEGQGLREGDSAAGSGGVS